MRIFVLWGIALLLLATPCRADHLAGELKRAGEVLRQDGVFYPAGDKITALYHRLLEADTLEAKLESLERQTATLEEQLREYRERAELSAVQKADFVRLKESYELHLGIYRDALKQYKALLDEARRSAEEALKMVQALGKENEALHKELRWTRLLGPLYLIVALLGLGAL